jgi:hypothetical protein
MKLSENGDKIYMQLYLDTFNTMEGMSRRWIARLTRWDNVDQKMDSFYQKPLDSMELRGYFMDRNTLQKQPEKRSDPIYNHSEFYFSGDFSTWQLKKTAKVSAYIDSQLNKLAEKFGRPRTFSEYILRVADAFQVQGFIYPDKNPTVSGRHWICRDASSARSYIESENYQYVKELFPEHEKTEESAA